MALSPATFVRQRFAVVTPGDDDDGEQGDGTKKQPGRRDPADRPIRAFGPDEETHEHEYNGRECSDQVPHGAAALFIHEGKDVVPVDGVAAHVAAERSRSIDAAGRSGTWVQNDLASTVADITGVIAHGASVDGPPGIVQSAESARPIPTGTLGIVLKALVVDDERPARDDLVWMLQRESEIAEIVEASCGAEALKLLGNTDDDSRFDVLFLDIRMPDLDGLDIARTVDRFESPPAIVFVTAFDTPASDAFELGVIDYLRKPVAADRLNRAIQRVRATRASSPVLADVDLQPARLAVATSGGRQLLLGPNDVTHFEASGDYVRVHADQDSYLVRDTMARLTDGWAKHGFIRIHRSFAVRLSSVSEVRSGPNGRSVLVGDEELPVSRRYARDLTSQLTGEGVDDL